MHTSMNAAIATLVLTSALAGSAAAAPPAVFDQRTVSHIGMVVRDVEKTARAIADVFPGVGALQHRRSDGDAADRGL